MHSFSQNSICRSKASKTRFITLASCRLLVLFQGHKFGVWLPHIQIMASTVNPGRPDRLPVHMHVLKRCSDRSFFPYWSADMLTARKTRPNVEKMRLKNVRRTDIISEVAMYFQRRLPRSVDRRIQKALTCTHHTLSIPNYHISIISQHLITRRARCLLILPQTHQQLPESLLSRATRSTSSALSTQIYQLRDSLPARSTSASILSAL
jgi:hypothetical protein